MKKKLFTACAATKRMYYYFSFIAILLLGYKYLCKSIKIFQYNQILTLFIKHFYK